MCNNVIENEVMEDFQKGLLVQEIALLIPDGRRLHLEIPF